MALICLVVLLLATTILSRPLSLPYSSTSIFEHSFHADMSNDYLTIERLQYLYNEKYFTHKCPRPLTHEYLLFKTLLSLENAYKR